jgi:hypothetical protein
MMETNIQQQQQPLNKLKCQLHVRENSKDELDALFDPIKFKNAKPLNKRNLPDSFFKPPEKGTKTPTHSRQGSIDSTLLSSSPSSSSTSINPQSLNQQIHKKILNNNHLRSNSEPVLINSFSLAASQQHNQDNVAYVAQRQTSVCSEQPLPHGWESAIATNGQRYYIK